MISLTHTHTRTHVAVTQTSQQKQTVQGSSWLIYHSLNKADYIIAVNQTVILYERYYGTTSKSCNQTGTHCQQVISGWSGWAWSDDGHIDAVKVILIQQLYH